MQKQTYSKWKNVLTKRQTNLIPVPRWGHTCCTIQDQVVFFGGYADSNYMNDLWSFNTTIMEWKQIKTFGDVPKNRSNCTMNYDHKNNRIIIFGGGGSNKKRFNTISILDWTSKQWLEIIPNQNQSGPWQRTYHSAQLYYPYLIVFGGQAVADLDDLWIFNFLNLRWKQVIIEKNKVRPSARRFHSSAIVKNQMYIIGGCHNRYRALNDVYSLNLTPLIENGDYSLQWKERKLQTSTTYLTRWGHSSNVKGDKIYIFGGRFYNDLNDLLVIDTSNNTIKTVKNVQDAPIARRRHCATFVGSSLIIFGGFNGQYFNDLHYINLQESKNWITKSQILMNLCKIINNPQYSTMEILDNNKNKIYLNRYLLLKAFKGNQKNLQIFLQYLSFHSCDKIEQLLRFLYTGIGEFSVDLFQKYSLRGQPNERFEIKSYFNMIKNELKKQSIQTQSFLIQSDPSGIIKLKLNQWQDLFDTKQYKQELDTCFELENQNIRVNSTLLRLNNQYFYNLLSSQFQESKVIQLNNINSRVFKVILKFLEYDILIYPENFTHNQWIQLLQSSQFYGINRLVTICQNQLSLHIQCNTNSNFDLFVLSVKNNFKNLKNFCAQIQVRKLSKLSSVFNYQQFDRIQKSNKIQQQMFALKRKHFKQLYFELRQNHLENQRSINIKGIFKKENYYQEESEKENNQINLVL